jgi:hypothetical protein
MLSRFLIGMFCVFSLCVAPQVFADGNSSSWLSAQSNPGFNPDPGFTLSSFNFEPIPFTSHTKKGNHIKANRDHQSFKLKKGSYLVTFSATFQNNPPYLGEANVDIGFQLITDCYSYSPEILYLKRFFAASTTGTELITNSGIIKVSENAVLQVVAMLNQISSPSLEVAVHNRNLSIIQLSD